MKAYAKIKEMLERELESLSHKTEMTQSNLDYIDKITHSIKSIDTIMAMEGYSEEYSEEYRRPYNYRNGSGMGGNMGGYNGSSQTRAMGRRTGGYSGESSKDEIITELRGLMYDAPEHMKNRLRDFISEIER